MGFRSKIAKCVNVPQIRALLWKDVLIKKRQPWMTTLQFLWPCAIFLTLYTLRWKFNAEDMPDCQFSTRELLQPNTVLPFFQSYICTFENECIDPRKYEEISEFADAPITPVINIVQTFMNEDTLYDAVINLPLKASFLETITIVATHPKFQLLEDNVNRLMESVEIHGTPVDSKFDIHKLFSDDETFSKSGTVFCGKPFPRSDTIRFVERIFYQEDFLGANQEELNAMPTKYCKQLYLDVSSSNNGKITWNHIKPIIQGKFLYGPVNPQTKQIIQNVNETLLAMTRLKNLAKSVDISIKKLRTDGSDFQRKFLNIVELAKSPFVQMMMANFNVDPKILDAVFDGLLHDKQVSDIIETVGNIFECFSVDRFIGVDTEFELEEKAMELNKKKLFYGGVYFNNNGYEKNKEFAYKLRMDVDNTPITLENRNRFWFPGPNANFGLEMRYHRGFIQIQHMFDQAIIKTVTDVENKIREEEWLQTTTTLAPTTLPTDEPAASTEPIIIRLDNSRNETEEKEIVPETNSTTSNGATAEPITNQPSSQALSESTEPVDDTEKSLAFLATHLPNAISTVTGKEIPDNTPPDNSNVTEESLAFLATQLPTAISTISRKRRQAADFLETILNGPAEEEDESKFPGHIIFGKTATFTKQFPYPKYRKDNFLKGLYLGQCIQLVFFFALIVQITNAARNRIWLKESGNSTLMRIMGLQKSSEDFAWIVSTFIDFAITFFLCEMILFTGGALQSTNCYLLYIFLLVFGGCVISFCYMVSTFFSSASIGSVSTVILFLMTYMPYILIVTLDALLGMWSKAATSLSFATAFCYAWRYMMRLELQERPLTFTNAFDDTLEENEFKFGLMMIFIDLILYAIIGYLYERFKSDEFKFHDIEKKDMDVNIGGALQNCTKKYDDSENNALENVSIIFRRNFVTCLLGRNGAGKSTIIKLLTGQIAPTGGHVYWPQNWDRITAHEYDERVGLCPQNNILIPNLTAREHLELYVRIKLNGKYDKKEVRRVMKDLQFGEHEDHYSQHLSGGFKRRLNVAIAFICSPNLVILDEPCSGVDMKARKNIWDLISILRQGRAVALATHYLDEAEHLSDSILIMNEGKVVAEYDPDQLKEQFTQHFELHIGFDSVDSTKAIESINALLRTHAAASEVESISTETLIARIPYHTDADLVNYSPLITDIEEMVQQQQIKNFRIVSSNLENIFSELVDPITMKKSHTNGNIHSSSGANEKTDEVSAIVHRQKLSELEAAGNLLKKRFLHFKRNYRLILCMLILPTLFVVLAMGFMKLRPPGEYDIDLQFSRALYSNSTDVYSIQDRYEIGNAVGNGMYEDLTSYCGLENGDVFGNICNTFNSSEKLARWVMNTTDDYPTSRYGGVSINGSRSAVWYNNNGYHAMPVFLNELNTAYFRSLMNDSDYKITTNNHPLKLDEKELTQSSILQQIADAGISLILLVAFSLVIAGASIYIVNERMNGEKLQQKLCGVSFKTYWGISFIWDYAVYIVAVLLAVVVFKTFDIAVYTAKDNLYGIIVLFLLFGISALQMVHLFEKLFNDASLANMYILCMNILIAMTTITAIILIDLLGDSDWSDKARDILNRGFLVLPQHAFADGLLEMCKNYVVSEIFQRYYIDTYKSPITTNLLLYHYVALIGSALVFWLLNFIVESGMWRSYLKSSNSKKTDTTLESITTSNANGAIVNGDTKHNMFDKFNAQTPDIALKVDSLSKTYDGRHYAAKDVTFSVKSGECFGLLGSNGAGKSTVFAMLSGELAPTSGTVCILNRENGVSYCPQSNALDNLLTVEEIIHFYGKLRRIENIPEITEQTLKHFHLMPYRNVLVKNLSGGNRRKLSVAVTCFGSSTNVLMDEPTSDMDPVTRSIVYASINRLLLEKRSVILTSHTITEIDRVCDRIGIMRQGKMIVTAPPQQLKTMYGNRYAITVYYDQIEALTIERDIKKAISNVENLIVHSHCLQFRIKIRNTSSSSHENGNIFNNNNETTHVSEPVIDDGMVLSDLFNKLYALTVGRGITFTVTECLLDQAFERVLEADESSHSYNNSAYSSETPT